MSNSASIARLLGPALIGITITEWVNLDVFRAAIGPSFGPHVYLNGTLLFVAGLAIVRAHNAWVRSWPVLITLVGWLGIIGGLSRMAAPVSAQRAGQMASVVYGSLVALLATGIVLTAKGYGRDRGSRGERAE
jgi:hypothetical protein